MAAGESPVAGSELLDRTRSTLEELYLGLRTAEGVPGERLPPETAGAWIEAGWAAASGGRSGSPPEGWLRLDALTAAAR